MREEAVVDVGGEIGGGGRGEGGAGGSLFSFHVEPGFRPFPSSPSPSQKQLFSWGVLIFRGGRANRGGGSSLFFGIFFFTKKNLF